MRDDQAPGRLVMVATVILAAIGMAGCQSAPTPPAAAGQSKPPASGSVTYDADHNVVVLVTPGPGPLGSVMQTWTWDGRLWTRKTPASSPPGRSDGLLTYDESRRVAVLQGGQGRSGALSDTWEWDGSNWRQRLSAHAPDPPQQPGSMAYDPVAHRMLLFQWVPRLQADAVQTWSWNGKDWTRLTPAHLPSFVVGTLAFDGQRLVLIGGSPDGDRLETWGWTGSDWNLLDARHAPITAFLPAAFHAGTHQVVLYGGGPGDDTWTWNGSTWARQHPRHSPAFDLRYLVYDRVLNRTVAIVGLSDGEAIKGIYGWDGADWSAMGADSLPARAAGSGLMRSSDAIALIRQKVTITHPVLLPQLPAGVDQATVAADSSGFSLRAWNDDRSTEVSIGIVVPGNSNLGAANKTIGFRRSSGEYQYIASDPRGWRSLWWMERPGYWPVPALKDQTGVPYLISATGMTEAEFFALANTLR
jgi:hypothetical protein